MSDKRISQLPAADTLTGAEKLPLVQGTETVRTTLQDVIDFIGQLPQTDPEDLGKPWVDPAADYVVKISQGAP